MRIANWSPPGRATEMYCAKGGWLCFQSMGQADLRQRCALSRSINAGTNSHTVTFWSNAVGKPFAEYASAKVLNERGIPDSYASAAMALGLQVAFADFFLGVLKLHLRSERE